MRRRASFKKDGALYSCLKVRTMRNAWHSLRSSGQVLPAGHPIYLTICPAMSPVAPGLPAGRGRGGCRNLGRVQGPGSPKASLAPSL